jgi:hypothetical protein
LLSSLLSYLKTKSPIESFMDYHGMQAFAFFMDCSHYSCAVRCDHSLLQIDISV